MFGLDEDGQEYEQLVRFARRLLFGDEELARDIVQTSLLRCWTKQQRGVVIQPAYVFMAVRNAIYDHGRRMKHHPTLSLSHLGRVEPADTTVRHNDLLDLPDALELTERQRQALRHVLAGTPIKAAAADVGHHSSYFRHALKVVRRRLEAASITPELLRGE